MQQPTEPSSTPPRNHDGAAAMAILLVAMAAIALVVYHIVT